MTQTPHPDAVLAADLDHAYVFHPAGVPGHRPLVLAGGLGSTVWDHDGTRYLDFASQRSGTTIGHQHPAVVAALARQAAALAAAAPGEAGLVEGQAARRVVESAGAGFATVHFSATAADAVDNAIRLARLATGRDTVLSAYRPRPATAGARGGRRHERDHAHFFGPYPYRSEFWASSPREEADRALQHLARVVEGEGPDTVAAILLETVPAESGVLVPPPGYLAGVRALAARYGIALILDESATGFGRAGEWFAFQADFGDGTTVVPDLVTFAAGSTSGSVPAGGVILSEEISARLGRRGPPPGLAGSGHPLAMAAIVATLDAIRQEGIIEHAREIGTDHLGPGLLALADAHPLVGDVRGLGVLWAVELVRDRESRQPVSPEAMARLGTLLLERDLLPAIVGNRLHVAPPAVVTPAEVAKALALFDEALTELDQRLDTPG